MPGRGVEFMPLSETSNGVKNDIALIQNVFYLIDF